jgi:hypothetical protein
VRLPEDIEPHFVWRAASGARKCDRSFRRPSWALVSAVKRAVRAGLT